MFFKNVSRAEWLALAVMITIGVATRFYLEIPNFKPIAAFVLFGAFYFRQPVIALIGVMGLMAISDFRLGAYDWQLMIAVYTSLAVAAILGIAIRRHCGLSLRGWKPLAYFTTASLAMSTIFFLLTNGAVWMMGSWYPMSLAGLFECYVAGLPFYRWTVLGDLFFTAATVGSYVLISNAGREPQSKPAAQVVA